ncbi:uncharacterized protein [Bemisia tabaci]|uniref:uncharacterized protein n=1 Tax=Bemisia tabaci TaxID=7038 RepID=UPI003B27E7D7
MICTGLSLLVVIQECGSNEELKNFLEQSLRNALQTALVNFQQTPPPPQQQPSNRDQPRLQDATATPLSSTPQPQTSQQQQENYRKIVIPSFKPHNLSTPQFTPRSFKRHPLIKEKPFYRQVILLDESSATTLSPEKREILEGSGFVKDHRKFDKNWTNEKLKQKISEWFVDVLNNQEIDFQFVKYNGKNLKSFIIPNEEIDGEFLNRNTKSIIYVKPSRDLTDTSDDSSSICETKSKILKTESASTPISPSSSSLKTSAQPSTHSAPCNEANIVSRNVSEPTTEIAHTNLITSSDSDSSSSLDYWFKEKPKGGQRKLPPEISFFRSSPFKVSSNSDSSPHPVSSQWEDIACASTSTAADNNSKLSHGKPGTFMYTDDYGRNHMLIDVKPEDISQNRENRLSVADVLASLQLQMHLKSTKRHIRARRDTLYPDMLRLLEDPSFSVLDRLSVRFECEVVVGKGPLKAFLNSLVLEVKEDTRIFEGASEKTLTYCKQSLKEGLYKKAGQILQFTFLHEGPRPQFLSKALFELISQGSLKNLELKSSLVPDLNTRHAIEQMENAANHHEVNAVIRDNESSYRCAVKKHFLEEKEFFKKEEILKDVLEYHLHDKIKDPLSQFKDGLNEGTSLLKYVEANPAEFWNIFGSVDEVLTAKNFIAAFSSYPVTEDEKRVLAHLKQFVKDCEGESAKVTLTDILEFATGIDNLPALGLSSLKRLFHPPLDLAPYQI